MVKDYTKSRVVFLYIFFNFNKILQDNPFSLPIYDPTKTLIAKIVLIGDSATGKSSILTRYADNTFEEAFLPTIGVDFKSKTFLHRSGRTIKMQVWDTAGQERFRSITGSYYRGSHGVIIVYDITNQESFNNVEVWLDHLEFRIGLDRKRILKSKSSTQRTDNSNLNSSTDQTNPSEKSFKNSLTKTTSTNEKEPSERSGVTTNSKASSIPIFIVGNKVDLKKERVVKYEHVKRYVDRSSIKNLHFYEASAKSDYNIHKLFQDLSDQVMKNEYDDGNVEVIGSDRSAIAASNGSANNVTLAQFRKGQFNSNVDIVDENGEQCGGQGCCG